jgi:hemoglobin/transferrin/lactoferrin receptor protein
MTPRPWCVFALLLCGMTDCWRYALEPMATVAYAAAPADCWRYALEPMATVAYAAAPDSLAATAARADSTAPDSATATAAGADSAAQAAPDSLRVPPNSGLGLEIPPTRSAARGVQDTVTVLRGVTVRSERPGPERATTTATRLDHSTLARFLPSTSTDAMVSVPGVDLVKTGPWASRVSFRGFQGERVLVMVDGVRLNTGRGHGSNASLVSVDRLDQVELTAGAAGAEYGSDAIGGVVNLVTHRPLFSPRPSLGATVSARGSVPGDEYTQSARLKYTSKYLGAELNGGVGHLNALVTPRERVANSGSHDDDFGARAAVRLGSAALDFEHTRHAAHDVGLPALDGSYPVISRQVERGEFEMPFMASVFGWGLPTRTRLLAVDQRYRTDFTETSRDTVISTRTHQPIAYHRTLAEDRVVTRSRGLEPEIRIGDKTSLWLGGEWRRETTSGPKTTTVTTTMTSGEVTDVATTGSENVPNAHRDVWAGSIGSSVMLGAYTIEGGARYDWIRSRAESTATSWSPELDVVDRRWSLDGGLAVRLGAFEPYGRVASGFRAPNLEERYYRGPVHGALDVFGNPDLIPERSITYEAGVRAAGGDWGAFRVSAYRTQSDDFITLQYLLLVGGRPRFTYANIQRAQIDGLELSGRARVRSITTQLAMTLPRGRDLATGDRLPDVGASRVTLDLTAPVGHWLPAGILALRARWSDGIGSDPLRQTQTGALSRPAFWTANAELGATFAGTRATFAIRNLFNNPYREPLSFIDEPARTYAFALKREFQVPLPSSRQEGSR